jgi:hypothetical protein
VVVELWRRNRAKLRVVPRPYLRITRDVCRRADGGRRQGFELFRTAERHRHGSINADADPHPVTDRESGAGSDRAYPVHEPDGFGRRERLDNGAVPFAALLDWHPPTGGHRPRRGGSYHEPGAGNIWQPTVSGTAAAPITVKAYPGEVPVFDGDRSGMQSFVLSGVSYIVVDGLTFTRYAPNGNGVLIISNAHHITVRNITMSGNVA